jgi:penicillin amidase
MKASLPTLDGKASIRGLASPVTVTRDALGTPTITGANRMDVARASGWLHAQDRFFQMDLVRRSAAGELSEIFGKGALAFDKRARMHDFRNLARQVVASLSPGDRAVMDAYTEGVNAGLAALQSKPWEYHVLRMEPRPWAAEDCFLLGYAIVMDLQDPAGSRIRDRAIIRDSLGKAALSFFDPVATPGDAALDGTTASLPPIPTPAQLDLRGDGQPAPTAGGDLRSDREIVGSNAFAVDAALGGGRAVLASDMHLRLGVPSVWYRASLKWPGHDETGVMFPGSPILIAGSTGKIAWGFTSAFAGVGDLVVVEPTISPELYRAPGGQGLLKFEHRKESIAVRGSKPVEVEYEWTIWGPVVGDAGDGRKYAYRWTEDDPSATNPGLLGLEDARDVADALSVAHRMGIPAQNMIVADSSGRIGWTVAGRLPRRIGYDGTLPVSWAYGDRRWDGYLSPEEIPQIVSPKGGLLWSANNRAVGGNGLTLLGNAGYDNPARAAQIRDDLAALAAKGTPITTEDMLGIQLDDRARMMTGWRDILLETLTPQVIAANPGRAKLLRAVSAWEGRASVDSVSYRVVRTFRLAVAHRVLDAIFASCTDREPEFRWNRLNYEQPLRQLVKARPPNLLDPSFKSWDDLMAAAADDVLAEYSRKGADPEHATWGEQNRAAISHPFALIAPGWAVSMLGMPRDPLPGDSYMPRIQGPSFGASERFAVSPGHEAEGFFHMPGGQVSNPLSPFFRAGHEAWVRGEPTPFLPGPAAHTLTLAPATGAE